MNKKVLVVDDDQGVLDVVSIILHEGGYQVQTSNKGHYALELNGDMPDLILLDILLSGEDGIEICKILKSRERTKHIPIIMFSAHSKIDQAVRDSGANGFLSKPFDMDVLLAMVKKHLRE